MTATTEFSLIQKYFSYDVERDDVVLGVGDDCALLSPPQGKQLAVTVDTLISGVHFPVSTSAEDIAYALESGFTPDFDSLGGSMAAVVENTAKLTSQDREEIAAYLKSVPELPRSETPYFRLLRTECRQFAS